MPMRLTVSFIVVMVYPWRLIILLYSGWLLDLINSNGLTFYSDGDKLIALRHIFSSTILSDLNKYISC